MFSDCSGIWLASRGPALTMSAMLIWKKGERVSMGPAELTRSIDVHKLDIHVGSERMK